MQGQNAGFTNTEPKGKEKRLAIGSFPAVDLDAARKARDATKMQRAVGIDPLMARKVEKLARAGAALQSAQAGAQPIAGRFTDFEIMQVLNAHLINNRGEYLPFELVREVEEAQQIKRESGEWAA